MVAGELTRHETGTSNDSAEQPLGSVVTSSGRVSTALDAAAQPTPDSPFSTSQLARLDDALTMASQYTRLRFSVYLGDLGGPARPAAEKLHDELGDAGADAVLIAVDPGARRMAIVTGPMAKVRLPDRSCHLAVMSMTASFSEGDLHGGLMSGLRMLADQAGRPH